MRYKNGFWRIPQLPLWGWHSGNKKNRMILMGFKMKIEEPFSQKNQMILKRDNACQIENGVAISYKKSDDSKERPCMLN
jgi:hypothetical protein